MSKNFDLPPIPGVPDELVRSLNDRFRRIAPTTTTTPTKKAQPATSETTIIPIDSGTGTPSLALAPNVTAATCTVSLIRWANATLPSFGGTFTLPASLGTLAAVEVRFVSAAGKRIPLARYESGLTGGGTITYSGYDPQIVQTSVAQTGNSVEFVCYNSDFVPTPSPFTVSSLTIPAAGITSYSVTDDVAHRWGGSPLQAVCPNTISLASYPQMVTIWSVSPQYGRIWHKWYEITGPGQVVTIGGQGTDTSIFPPTNGVSSEVVRFWCAIGAWGSEVDPTTVTGAAHYDVTIAAPANPPNTGATGFYIMTATPQYSPGPDGAPRRQFSFQIRGHLPITASDTPDQFKAMRMCIETRNAGGALGGQRPNPMDPLDKRTVVGDYAAPTAWILNTEDHDRGIIGDPTTGQITWSIVFWDVPVDGYPDFYFSIWLESRREVWIQQNCWSSAAGVSTPGTNATQKLSVDDSQTATRTLSIATSAGTVNVGAAVSGVQVTGGGSKLEVHNTEIQGFSGGSTGFQIDNVGSATFGGKLSWDTNGRLTKYDNMTLAGKGLPHIIYRTQFTGQTGALSFTPTYGGANLVGHLEIKIAAVLRPVVLAAYSGSVSVLGSYAYGLGSGFGSFDTPIAQTVTSSGSGLTTAASAVVYTNGVAVTSAGYGGVHISTIINTALSNAVYDLYVVIAKLDD